MDKIEIKIVTPDSDYGRALAQALMEKEEFSSISLVEEPVEGELYEKGKSEASEPEDREYVIYLIEGRTKKKENIIYLRNRRNTDSDNEITHFYKYDSLRVLYGNILQLYGRLSGWQRTDIESFPTKILTVFSLSGGGGTTSLTLGLAQEYQRFEEKRVLYLSLEPYPETEQYFVEGSADKGLKEFLYYFTQNNQEKIHCLKPYVVADDYGVHSFFLQGLHNPLLDLTNKEWQDLLIFLSQNSFYDLILIDGSNTLSKKLSIALGLSHQVLSLIGHKTGPENMEEELLQGKGVYQKARWIFLQREPVEEVKEERDFPEERAQEEMIPYDPDSFSSGKREKKILLDGTFGLWIKELCSKLTYI